MNDKVILRLDQKRLEKRKAEIFQLIQDKELIEREAHAEAVKLRIEYLEVCELLRQAEEKIDAILGDPADGAPTFPIGNT